MKVHSKIVSFGGMDVANKSLFVFQTGINSYSGLLTL